MRDNYFQAPPLRRNPPGVVTSKPIRLALMPDELKAIRDTADRMGISYAAAARQAVINGLPKLLEQASDTSAA